MERISRKRPEHTGLFFFFLHHQPPSAPKFVTFSLMGMRCINGGAKGPAEFGIGPGKGLGSGGGMGFGCGFVAIDSFPSFVVPFDIARMLTVLSSPTYTSTVSSTFAPSIARANGAVHDLVWQCSKGVLKMEC